MDFIKQYTMALFTLTLSIMSTATLATALNPLQLAMAQPLLSEGITKQHAIIGQWHCEYTQQLDQSVMMQVHSVDDYFADGRNHSLTQMTIQLPQKNIHYQIDSSSDWHLLADNVLQHQNWRLNQFEVDDPEMEKLLNVRQSLAQKTEFKSQILKVDAHQAVVRSVEPDSVQNSETTCYR